MKLGRLTLFLALLLGGLVAVLWITNEQEIANEGHVAPPFESFGEEEITGIRIAAPDDDGGRRVLQLRRRASGEFRLWRDDVEGEGAKVRPLAVAQWMESFLATRPLRVRRSDPDVAALEGAGLGARDRVEIRVDLEDGTRRFLHLGATDGAGGLSARVDGEGPILVVDAFLRDELLPGVGTLLDPSLVPFRELDVERLVVAPREGETLELRREGDRWLVERPYRALGDARRVEALRHAVCGPPLLGHAEDGDALSTDEEAEFLVHLWSPRADEMFTVRVGERRGDRVLVRVPDREGARLVHAELLTALGAAPETYRDRRLLPVLSDRIHSFTLSEGGREAVHYRRQGRTLLVGPTATPGVKPRSIDPVLAADLLDRLTGVELETYRTAVPEFPVTRRLEVEWVPLGAGERVRRRFDLGPETAEGMRLLRIGAGPEGGVVRAEEVAFLFEPWWSRLGSRLEHPTDAYFRLGRIVVRDDRGRVADLEGYIPEATEDGPADLAARVQTPSGAKLVPMEVLDPVRRLLINALDVESWIGARDPIADDELLLEVRFQEVMDADPKGMRKSPDDPWRVLRFAQPGADGLCRAQFSGDVELAFFVRQEELLPLVSLLDWLEG